MEINKLNEIVEFRDKREELVNLLNRLNSNDDPHVSVSYYSEIFNEIISPSLHLFEDLQTELNDVVKTWLINKINEIDNVIKEL